MTDKVFTYESLYNELSKEPTFRSDIKVTLVQAWGFDATVAESAWRSTGTDVEPERIAGLIRRLQTDRHSGPFEHCGASFDIEVPLFTGVQHLRHRTQSFSVLSGRYGALVGEFYIPPPERPLSQTGKKMDYELTSLGEPQTAAAQHILKSASQRAWTSYLALLQVGVAPEIARSVLGPNIYTDYRATANLLNWLRFLSLRGLPRADDPKPLFVTHPQWEINQVAMQIEEHLDVLFPATMDSWRKAGRP